MKNLPLHRDLVFLDLETTDKNPSRARIVEVSILLIEVGGERTTKTWRVNPGCAISPEATAVHGISNADVREEPLFADIADELDELLRDADLAGFNLLNFDLPVLAGEFQKTGRVLQVNDRHVIDVMRIFHRKEPRDLRGAVRFYLDREHAEAHSAEADVSATVEVLEAQLDRYADLAKTVAGLGDLSRGDDVDLSSKFVRRDGEVIFNFGKHEGRPLKEVARTESDYLHWVLGQDFPPDVKDLINDALEDAGAKAETTSTMSRTERLAQRIARREP